LVSFVCFFLPISFGFAKRKNKNNKNKKEQRRVGEYSSSCSKQAGGDLVAAAGWKGEKAYHNAHAELVLFCLMQKQIHNVSLQRNGL
jgi:hypothetical protein